MRAPDVHHAVGAEVVFDGVRDATVAASAWLTLKRQLVQRVCGSRAGAALRTASPRMAPWLFDPPDCLRYGGSAGLGSGELTGFPNT